jgi:hypothetical protein
VCILDQHIEKRGKKIKYSIQINGKKRDDIVEDFHGKICMGK